MKRLHIYYPEFDYDYSIIVGKDEVIEFLYSEKMGKPYDPFMYMNEEGGRETYNSLENSWLNNELDEYKIFNDPKFYEFCKDRFEDDAREEAWQEDCWREDREEEDD